jgi:hypothetical protein
VGCRLMLCRGNQTYPCSGWDTDILNIPLGFLTANIQNLDTILEAQYNVALSRIR